MENTVAVPFASINDFVDKAGGQHAIKRILIANNGIGAVKLIRSVRRWAYEMFANERAVSYITRFQFEPYQYLHVIRFNLLRWQHQRI